MAAPNSAERDLYLIRGQIWPRRREILKSWAAWSSGVISIALTVTLNWLPGANLTISSVATFGITYACISAGGCFSAIVLSLGLPGAQRLRSWARKSGTIEGKSALSDLIFVLAWAGLAQIALILTCSFSLAFGGNLEVAPSGASILHCLGLFFGLFVFFYSVLELIIVLQTLVQIGVVIIAEEQKEPQA